jgi:hypothetical protein
MTDESVVSKTKQPKEDRRNKSGKGVLGNAPPDIPASPDMKKYGSHSFQQWADAVVNNLSNSLSDVYSEADLKTLTGVLTKVLPMWPEELAKLIGTGIIEKDHFGQ